MTNFAHLLPSSFEKEVIQWLQDDCPSFDIGGFVVGEKEEVAKLYCKENGVLAGVPFVDAIARHLNLICRWNYEEGTYIDVKTMGDEKRRVVAATISGKCRSILLAERTMLNILARASGIATAAHRARRIKEQRNWHGFVAGTRKTTPGFRTVEKYALIVGGVATHRLDLSQMVMLKDNHIWSAGNITNAVKMARTAAGFSCKIEVECQSVEEALEAAEAGADIVMLDNCTPETIHPRAKQVKDKYPSLLIEASGGITEENMGSFMSEYVDIISRGSLTQGKETIELSRG